MNDHSNHRRRSSQPAWPTGDDPDVPASPRQAEERTGFWSPLWEDDDDQAPSRHGRSNGHHNGHANGHANGGSNGRAAHRLTEGAGSPGGGSHRAEPQPPRSGARHSAPAWPTEEPPAPTRPAGPNGAPGQNGRPGVPPIAEQRTRVIQPRPGGPGRPAGPRSPGGPGADPDGPTELLPSVRRRGGPEPELLTHREPGQEDLDEDYYDDEDVPLSEDQKKLRRKRIWRRVRRTGYVLTALMIILPLLGFFIAYQVVTVPSPQSIADGQRQVAKLTYANDEQLAEVVPEGGENRRMVTYEEIPEQVKNAVFAAEDADFMTNPGFDITGVMRAGWNQVTGGEGGGSTITQQYIKKATRNEEKTITRKAVEVVQAYKMNNTYSKEEIITAYLNTIYFGRGAYGIAAAADAYYGKEKLADVTASEAALLAGMIQNPSRFDEPDYMQRRWKFVVGQMVEEGWFPSDEASTAKFPEPIPIEQSKPKANTGPEAHIQRAVFEELKREADITEDEIFRRGLIIKTTIDKRAQDIALKSVRETMKGQPKEITPALVAVNPKNGRVLAYFGGENGIGTDWAAAEQEPGSSFKPFDLVALLQKGKGLGARYDGTSGRMFPGRDDPVRNAGDVSCGEQCTVATAMEKSINTVFYEIATLEVGTPAVARAAQQAGITSDLNGEAGPETPPDGNISIGGGNTRVSALEMASAYATFASGGIYREPHLVTEVRYPDGQIRWSPQETTKLAFDEANQENNQKIARNVTESLMPVLEYSELECSDDRECAGKTGTHEFAGNSEENSKAWMVGYTPQISTAVALSAQDKENRQLSLKNKDGNIVYGSGLPGEIWQKFMNRYLEGQPKESFGPFEAIGEIEEEVEDEPRRDDDDNRRRGRDDDDGPTRPRDEPPPITQLPEPTFTVPTEPTVPTDEPTGPTITLPGGGGGGGGGGGDGDFGTFG